MAKKKVRADWTSILIGEGPCGILCIQKPERDYWEFPGGKRHANDRTPIVTVVRETREETGLRLAIAEVTLLGSSMQFNHYNHRPFQLCVYQAKLTDVQLAHHFALSREGEKVAVFTRAQLNAMGDTFSPFHRMLGLKYGVLQKW